MKRAYKKKERHTPETAKKLLEELEKKPSHLLTSSEGFEMLKLKNLLLHAKI